MDKKTISVIVPCYEEAEVLPEFYRRITAVAEEMAGYDLHILFVNDGSKDQTAAILNGLAEADFRVKVLTLARNYGHQIALTAGLDHAYADVVVTIDADLQDPPEFIRDMVLKTEEGWDMVHAQRRKRHGETAFKLFTAWLFYCFMRKMCDPNLVSNSGDFRAFTKPVLTAIRSLREPHRFVRGMFSSLGFRQCVLQYDRDPRFAGETKYPFKKMLYLAINAVLAFSTFPIRFVIALAGFLWALTIVYLGWALYQHFVLDATIKGWTSLILLQTFFTGLILLSLALVGSYVGRIFQQGQNRPLYLARECRNFDWDKIVRSGMVPYEVVLSRDILCGEDGPLRPNITASNG